MHSNNISHQIGSLLYEADALELLLAQMHSVSSWGFPLQLLVELETLRQIIEFLFSNGILSMSIYLWKRRVNF